MARSRGAARSKRFGIASRRRPGETAPVKIGLLSDTHNHLHESRQALDRLVARGARHLVHCGDAGEDVVDLVSAVCQEHGIRAHIAIGNCDRAHWEDLPFLPRPAGVERDDGLEFVLAGKHCLVLHGDNAWRLEQATASGKFDYIFTGHTHAPADRRQGRTRLLNPGSAVRPRQGPPTALLLDLATDAVEWLRL